MLPAGMNEDGVIEDMQAYDARLADEQTQRDMQRREEVNINHSHRHDEQDDVEIEGISDAQFQPLNRRAVPVTTTQRKTITTSSGAWRSAGRVKAQNCWDLKER